MTDQQKQSFNYSFGHTCTVRGLPTSAAVDHSRLWLASPAFIFTVLCSMFRLNCLFTQALQDSRRKIAKDYSGNMARYKLHLNCVHPLLILYNIIMSAYDNLCPCVLINRWLEHSLSHLRAISCAKLVYRWQFTKTQSMSSFYSAYQVSS